jgi:hypothetical protein
MTTALFIVAAVLAVLVIVRSTKHAMDCRNATWGFVAAGQVCGLVGFLIALWDHPTTATIWPTNLVLFGVTWLGILCWTLAALRSIRPLLGSVSTRPAGLATGAFLMVGAAGLVSASAHRFHLVRQPSFVAVSRLGTAVCFAISVALIGASASSRRTAIRIDLVFLSVAFAHFAAEFFVQVHDAAEDSGRRAVSLLLATSGVLVCSLLGNFSNLSSRKYLHVPFARIRMWPITVVLIAAGAASLTPLNDRPSVNVTTQALFVGSVLFAAREMLAGYKPLLLPFTARERAAHRVFRDLVYENVRLLGRPVRRVADAVTVAIEAYPEWSHTPRATNWSMQSAARDARIETDLDHYAVRMALFHAPAVLYGLPGEPWLSVSVAVSTLQAGLPESLKEIELDGLVLRITSSPESQQIAALDRWREQGAWIHLDVPELESYVDFDPDFITVQPSNGLSSAFHYPKAWPFVRSGSVDSSISAGSATNTPVFVVDPNEGPTGLGMLLSSIARRGHDEYVRPLKNASQLLDQCEPHLGFVHATFDTPTKALG